MSRGPGIVQRSVLELLWAERAAHRPELWFKVRDIELEEVMPESVRRAVQGLKRLGLVDTRIAGGVVEWAGSTKPDRHGRTEPMYSETFRQLLFTRVALGRAEAIDADVLRGEFEQHRKNDPQFRIQGFSYSPVERDAIAWCGWYSRPEWPRWPALRRYDLDSEYGPLPIPMS